MDNSDFRLNPQEQGLHISRLAAAAAGSVDPTALWQGASAQIGPVLLSQWVTRTDSATLGSLFKIRMRGFYKVSAWVRLNAGPSSAAISVTLDAIGLPDPSATETASFQGITLALEGPMSLVVEGIVCVTQFAASSPGLGIIRIAIDDNAGSPVDPAVLFLNGSGMRILRLCDVNSAS
jgi:hypothetical protein